MKTINKAKGHSVVNIVYCCGPLYQPFRWLCEYIPSTGGPLVDWLLYRAPWIVRPEWIELRPVAFAGKDNATL